MDLITRDRRGAYLAVVLAEPLQHSSSNLRAYLPKRKTTTVAQIETNFCRKTKR